MTHFILFTGHMIDAKDRAQPRFPAQKENEVRQVLYKHIRAHVKNIGTDLLGIASGACGGDILFHEICGELNIPSEVFLALPAEEFKKNSVSFAGSNWDDRFDKLIQKLSTHVLPETQGKPNDNIYERTNNWMLETALANGGKNMTLLALWNGDRGDGTGGTQHMVTTAQKQDATIEIIDIIKI